MTIVVHSTYCASAKLMMRACARDISRSRKTREEINALLKPKSDRRANKGH